jgi:hypothetical protein
MERTSTTEASAVIGVYGCSHDRGVRSSQAKLNDDYQGVDANTTISHARTFTVALYRTLRIAPPLDFVHPDSLKHRDTPSIVDIKYE